MGEVVKFKRHAGLGGGFGLRRGKIVRGHDPTGGVLNTDSNLSGGPAGLITKSRNPARCDPHEGSELDTLDPALGKVSSELHGAAFISGKISLQAKFHSECMDGVPGASKISVMDKKGERKVTPRFKGVRRKTFIRQWRKHRRLTLEQVVERTGMSVGNLSQIERGEYEYTQGALEAIADALQCEPADLLMRNPLDPEAPWSLWEAFKTPEQRRQAIRLLRALAGDAAA